MYESLKNRIAALEEEEEVVEEEERRFGAADLHSILLFPPTESACVAFVVYDS
jgi:hypothetical protein